MEKPEEDPTQRKQKSKRLPAFGFTYISGFTTVIGHK